MLLIVPLIILCVLAGIMLCQTLAIHKRLVASNSNRCIECNAPVPDGFHLCMSCWSHSERDKDVN
jgi:hypothetical protein